jgi:hypothetical protein
LFNIAPLALSLSPQRRLKAVLVLKNQDWHRLKGHLGMFFRWMINGFLAANTRKAHSIHPLKTLHLNPLHYRIA